MLNFCRNSYFNGPKSWVDLETGVNMAVLKNWNEKAALDLNVRKSENREKTATYNFK